MSSSSTHHSDGTLFLHLRPCAGATLDECQWGIYIHNHDAEGGTLYQVKMIGSGLVADHQQSRDIFRDSGELKTIGYVPYWKLDIVDGHLRSLDKGLEFIKEKTSLKWVFMVVSLLMEETIVKPQSLKRLKQELADWADVKRAPVNDQGREANVEALPGKSDVQAGQGGNGIAGSAIEEDILGRTEGE